MVDIPGNNTTTSSVAVGSTVTGVLEVAGDHDWFRITLTAGQTIKIALNGTGATILEDPFLRIRDASGNIIFENDDGGAGRNSLVTFTVPASGTYYIDVSAWDTDPPQYNYTGEYQLQVSLYTPPPLATVNQIADHLTDGFWDGQAHHFAVTQGGSLTVNLTALTADGQGLAREALRQWTDVIGVTFSEVAVGGQITFDDNEEGAFSSSVYAAGVTSSAHVNISTAWLASQGTAYNTYSFQTYLHEIGHALGLGHAGNYDGEASFPTDALFLNDAWSMSVMSYFSPTENTHFAQRGFTDSYLGTPMLADFVAMGNMYGLSTTTRAGNTTYGFNSNAGNIAYNASLYPTVAYTVFDSGGIDTLDYSGFGQNQIIDLTAGNFSNINGRIGNVNIAIGTVIENASGGSGNDELRGNEAANQLIGNGGNDRAYGLGGNDLFLGGIGDDYFDGGAGIDTFSFADAAAGINLNLQVASSPNNAAGIGTDSMTDVETIIGSGFADTFLGMNFAQRFEGGAGNDTFTGQGGADVFVGGAGADIFRDTRDGLNGDTIVDFTADDRLIFADATPGAFTFSLSGNTLTYTGGSLTLGGVLSGGLSARAVAGGVGMELFITRGQFGTASLQLADFGAGATAGSWTSDNRYPRMLGDVNGDGRADIIGFGETGAFLSLGLASGSFALPTLATTSFGAGASAGGWASNDIHLRQLADVNGDGRADIVGFGNNGVYASLSNGNGSFGATTLVTTAFGSAAGAGGWSTNDRYLRLVADVNGDGKADIVGFGNDGVYVSLATQTGAFAGPILATTAFGFGANAGGWTSNDRYLRQVADMNGDGRADIVGFGIDGVYVSLAQANGTFAAPTLSLREFGTGAGAGGWSSDDRFPRELADVNGDDKIDIVGFGNNGVYIALGRGNGGFDAGRQDLTFFGVQPGAGGWASDDLYPRQLADVNNDGAADIVGFASTGVFVSLSGGDILT